jgi:high-affinity Fe2+/Pb2+ permease
MVNKKRNRIITLLLLPIATMLFMLGWVMLLTGSRNEQKNQPEEPKTAPQGDGIIVLPMIPEEIENN